MFVEFFDSFSSNSSLFTYVILPILIFCARVSDVTLGTLRIIFVSKGYKLLAPLLGFFEVLIWVIAISQLLGSLSSWVCYVAYAGGFAAGNFVGMIVEERIAIGKLLVRITTPKDAHDLMLVLSANGFGATLIEGEGVKGKVNIIQSVVSRKSLKELRQLLGEYDENLFYSIEDTRSVIKGVFPKTKTFGASLRIGK